MDWKVVGNTRERVSVALILGLHWWPKQPKLVIDLLSFFSKICMTCEQKLGSLEWSQISIALKIPKNIGKTKIRVNWTSLQRLVVKWKKWWFHTLNSGDSLHFWCQITLDLGKKGLFWGTNRKLNHSQRTTFIKGPSQDSKQTNKNWRYTRKCSHCAMLNPAVSF